MEIKMNKEIRDYAETMFFGLSLRQFLFSALGCLLSVGIFFLFRDRLGTEAVTWACILGVFPCGILGFAKYNGMTAERFLWAVIKSQVEAGFSQHQSDAGVIERRQEACLNRFVTP